jgi:hypothetical protein
MLYRAYVWFICHSYYINNLAPHMRNFFLEQAVKIWEHIAKQTWGLLFGILGYMLQSTPMISIAIIYYILIIYGYYQNKKR